MDHCLEGGIDNDSCFNDGTGYAFAIAWYNGAIDGFMATASQHYQDDREAV